MPCTTINGEIFEIRFGVFSVIRIDHEKCILCKSCVSNCHTTCMTVHSNKLAIDYELCSTCCQCIAICPNGALTWEGQPSREIQVQLLPKSENILELLKARRSIRKFRNQQVEPDKLQYICQVAKLAPTNVYDIELIAITDSDLINDLEHTAINFIRKANSRLYSFPPAFKLLKRLTPAINEIDKIKTINTLKRESIFHGAPALIMLLADPRITHSELSCQYSLYNMALIAQTMGIGSCISGAAKTILSRNKEVNRKLNIPKHKKILGVLFLGYPNVHYICAVEGNNAPVRWFTSGASHNSVLTTLC